MDATEREATAERVVVSYRAADPDPDADTDSGFADEHLVHDRIRADPFLGYLRRVHAGDVTAGEEWTEFVNCGCGTTTDVVLRVESAEGGTALGATTDVELVPFGGRGEGADADG